MKADRLLNAGFVAGAAGGPAEWVMFGPDIQSG